MADCALIDHTTQGEELLSALSIQWCNAACRHSILVVADVVLCAQ